MLIFLQDPGVAPLKGTILLIEGREQSLGVELEGRGDLLVDISEEIIIDLEFLDGSLESFLLVLQEQQFGPGVGGQVGLYLFVEDVLEFIGVFFAHRLRINYYRYCYLNFITTTNNLISYLLKAFL